MVGGTPVRVLRLRDDGIEVFARLAAGEAPWSASSAALARRLLDGGLAHPVPGDTGPPPADVDVVVPVRDDASGLERLLSSGTLSDVARVVVVDDGSERPDAGEIARRHGADVIVNSVSEGPGGARERGWRAGDAPVVAFVDADCVPESGWLRRLLCHLADPDVVAVAPRVAGVNGPDDHLLARYEADHGPIDRGVGPAKVGAGAVTFVPGAALVVRRSALEGVGGFDVSMRIGEDVDLVWRLMDLGAVRYEPAATVTHRSRPTLRSWLRQRFRYGVSAAALDARHPGRVRALDLHPWTALSWGLAILAPGRWRSTGALAAAASTTLLARRLRGSVDQPVRLAVELAGRGNLTAGSVMAEVARREWWPVSVAALGWRRTRLPASVALVGVPLAAAIRRRPRVGVVKATALKIADDVAYGTGVWVGCRRARRWGPLRVTIRRSLR